VRTALQALSGVLGGAQSLHTNGLDEAYAIPSELAMKVALRTQQIIAEETRVAQVVDPLGGSWYLESLTSEIEKRVFAILDQVERMGGTVKAIEQGFFQSEIAETAYQTSRKRASGEQPWVGVNRYVDSAKKEEIEIHKIDPATEQRQIARTREVRRARDGRKVAALLDRLESEARDPAANLMPATIELVRARATMGEIVTRLKRVFGTYTETPVF
jgi:methylmalonyl-CoA mutase N-terminal domain/subunit